MEAFSNWTVQAICLLSDTIARTARPVNGAFSTSEDWESWGYDNFNVEVKRYINVDCTSFEA